ncbi:hypothetical protein ES708_33292 [subsurface metagenome]
MSINCLTSSISFSTRVIFSYILSARLSCLSSYLPLSSLSLRILMLINFWMSPIKESLSMGLPKVLEKSIISSSVICRLVPLMETKDFRMVSPVSGSSRSLICSSKKLPSKSLTSPTWSSRGTVKTPPFAPLIRGEWAFVPSALSLVPLCGTSFAPAAL